MKKALENAVEFHKSGEIEKAKELYFDILRKSENLHCRNNLALIYVNTKEISSAEKQISQLIKLLPKRPEHWQTIQKVCRQTNEPKLVWDAILISMKLKFDAATQSLIDIGLEKFNTPLPKDEITKLKEDFNNKNNNSKIIELSSRSSAFNSEYLLLTSGAAMKRNQAKLARLGFLRYCILNSKEARSWFNLGMADFHNQDYRSAVKHFEEAVKLDPKHQDAIANLITSCQVGGLYNVGAEYIQSIDAKDQSLNLAKSIGNFLVKFGKTERALEHYEQVMSRFAGDTDLLFGKGTALLKKNDEEAAIVYLEKAARKQTTNPQLFNNLGVAYQALGDREKAETSFERALSLKEDYAEAWRNFGRTYNFRDDIDRVKRLEQLAEIECNIESLIEYNFALGKAYRDLGDYEKSFKYYIRGNSNKRSVIKYDPNEDRLLFRKIQESFTNNEATLNSPKLKFTKNPIFIVGMPRSGTTLLEQIVSNHSKIDAKGELNNLAQSIIKCGWPKKKFELDADISRQIAKEYMDSVESATSFFTDKLPLNFRWLGFIAKGLPDAKILHIKRNKYATCWSIFQQLFSSTGNRFAYDLNDIENFYYLYENLMDFWEEKLGDQIYHVRYEELVDDPKSQITNIIKYLDLDMEAACFSPETNKRKVSTASVNQVRQKIYKGSSESYLKYGEYLRDYWELN
jgi:tetratricopeptide (TPR) repeat protein